MNESESLCARCRTRQARHVATFQLFAMYSACRDIQMPTELVARSRGAQYGEPSREISIAVCETCALASERWRLAKAIGRVCVVALLGCLAWGVLLVFTKVEFAFLVPLVKILASAAVVVPLTVRCWAQVSITRATDKTIREVARAAAMKQLAAEYAEKIPESKAALAFDLSIWRTDGSWYLHLHSEDEMAKLRAEGLDPYKHGVAHCHVQQSPHNYDDIVKLCSVRYPDWQRHPDRDIALYDKPLFEIVGRDGTTEHVIAVDQMKCPHCGAARPVRLARKICWNCKK